MGEPLLIPERKLNTELTEYSAVRTNNDGPYADGLEVDALIVGAGFAGIFMLKTLRDQGFKVAIYEAGHDIGGTWRWNCYPGARVDSEVPEYEFSWPEVWKTWNWSTNYPTYAELRSYFDHVDKIIGVKKDVSFNTVVVGAKFDTKAGRWNVRTEDGRTATSKYLVLGTGFSARRYIPDWSGIEKFKGVIHHSSFWPDKDIDVKNKRCAVIGTGASGVQVAQEWGPLAGELKVFQRTPNLALPMKQKNLTPEEQEAGKKWYPQLFEYRENTTTGFLYDWNPKNTFDDTPEQREAVFERAWSKGGFHLWVGSYKDIILDAKVNDEFYNFWVKKVRARIGDPRKRDLLAPLKKPHHFGIKRPCLERTFYEQFNRENVDVINIENNGVREFTETGITLEDGTHYEFDVIAIATGFDVATGAMTQLGLNSIHDTNLQEEWKAGANTYLGTTVSGYPNMFHLYGVHGPTLFSNGPTTIEVQGRWVTDCIQKMELNNIKYIDPKPEASKAWKEHVLELNNSTLFPTTRSTYMGGSIPGKPFEPTSYTGGIPLYTTAIRKALDSMEGFTIVKD